MAFRFDPKTQWLAAPTGIHLNRASVAMFGLGANRPEDAIYPNRADDADGRSLTGERDHQLWVAPGHFPPANAFLSLTLYDRSGYPVKNASDRHAIGDRASLQLGDGGSVTLYILHEPQAHTSPACCQLSS